MKTKSSYKLINFFVLALFLLGTALNGTTPAMAEPAALPAAEQLEAPSAQGGAPTTFAIISDFGTGSGAAPTANMVKSWNPEFIITAGDNNQGNQCDTDCYANLVGTYYGDYLTPGSERFWPAIGNHDTYSPTANYLAYFSYLPPSGSTGNQYYYDFVQGPVHFFMMDSEVSDKSTQKTWLQPRLETSTAPWKIVVFHTPAASAGQWGSSAAMQWDFAGWGADFVIQAHNHIYERIEWNDIVYFTTGAGGGNARTNHSASLPTGAVTKAYEVSPNANGATKVTASNTEIKFEFYTNNTSTPKDTYTQTRQSTTGTIYRLTDTLEAGKKYLVVSGSSAGPGYILARSSTTHQSEPVTVIADSGGNYIEANAALADGVWTAEKLSDGVRLKNGNYYLEASGSTSAINIVTSPHASRYWRYNTSSGSTSGANELWMDGTYNHIVQFNPTGNVFYSAHHGNVKNPDQLAYIYVEEEGTVQPIALTGVSISGTPKVGQTLTAALTPSGATASYQWQSASTSGGSYTNISGATGSTYVLAAGDLGKYIRVKATGTGSYTGEVTSAAIGPVEQASTTGTIYRLTNTLEAGKKYLVVSQSTAGSGYILAHTNTTGTDTHKSEPVTVIADSGGNYIEASAALANGVWTAVTEGGGLQLKNSSYYLYASTADSVISVENSLPHASRYWRYNTGSKSSTGVNELWIDGTDDHIVQFNPSTSKFYSTRHGSVKAAEVAYIYVEEEGSVDPTVINSVAVTVTAPVALASPNTTATVPVGSNYTASAVTWTPNDNPFEYNTVYTASVTLTAATGYTFSTSPSATVNGNPATTVTRNSDTSLTVSYTFPRTAADPGESTGQITFGMDVHQSASNFTQFLTCVKNDGVIPDVVAQGGDFNNHQTPGTAYNSAVIDPIVEAVFPNADKLYTQGNNDAFSLVGTGNFVTTGPAYEKDNYIIYAINEYDFPLSSISSNGGSTATKNAAANKTINDLRTFLTSKKGAGKVIFILSHVPLHQSRNDNPYGYNMASMLNDVIDGDLDVVFLWGHNHTTDASQTYRDRGSTVSFYNGTTGQNLVTEFIYAAAGYINGSSTNSSVIDSGTVATVTDTQIILTRYRRSNCNKTETLVVNRYKPGQAHTVIFNANGGSGTMTPQQANVPTALKPNTFTRAGYTFAGWNTAVNGSGTSYADEAIYSFAANITLYAQWTALPMRTVTFNANGGSGTMTPQQANVPTALKSNTFTRAGYTFAGWNTAANGSGTSYADEAVYSFAANITLYAQWTALPMRTVIFNANGGSGTMTPQQANVPTALTKNTFTRAGYTFAGWNTAANGSGTSYADEAVYSFAADMTLYAQWEAIAYTLTINITGNGTVSKNPDQTTYTYGQVVTLTANPGQGYSFSYWSGDLTGETSPATLTIDGNKTVTANFDRLITVTVDENQSKIYGEDDPEFTYISSEPAAPLTGKLGREPGENVGSYAINQGSLTAPAGYKIVFIGADFTITKKAASVTPSNASKVYGEADPALTGTIEGFLASDVVIATYSRESGETVADSPYEISATLKPAAVLGNYEITYNTANFTITKRRQPG